MGICAKAKVMDQPVNFTKSINDYNINEINRNNQIIAKDNLIKLDFSLDNCIPGYDYQIKLSPLFHETEKLVCLQNLIEFEKSFICEFFFEKLQPMQIEVFKKGKTFGSINTFLSIIVGSPNSIFRSIILKGNPEFISISAQSIPNNFFINYIKNGVQIKFSIGIDFTNSNGNINDANSLHRIVRGFNDDFEQAIKCFGPIMSHYHYDELFPVYGFGAITNRNNPVPNMCFNINFNENPEIYTIDNVINHYHNCLKILSLSEPIQFCPVIRKEIEMITRENNLLIYHVLMILTSGSLTDLDETIEAVIEASYLPFSLIIIGIGDGDFTKMMKFDINAIPANKKRILRDSVKFVIFNAYKNNTELQKKVFEDIPNQIVEYYSKIKINPNQLTADRLQTLTINYINSNFK